MVRTKKLTKKRGGVLTFVITLAQKSAASTDAASRLWKNETSVDEHIASLAISYILIFCSSGTRKPITWKEGERFVDLCIGLAVYAVFCKKIRFVNKLGHALVSDSFCEKKSIRCPIEPPISVFPGHTGSIEERRKRP